MSFRLTASHVRYVLEPAASGDWSVFSEAISPDVHWFIGAEDRVKERATGIFNLASWTEDVHLPLFGRLKDHKLEMRIQNLDVIGQKAIVECAGAATQNNGKPYNNRYCWILIFSEETGKIVEIREYLNTALVQEALENNELK